MLALIFTKKLTNASRKEQQIYYAAITAGIIYIKIVQV